MILNSSHSRTHGLGKMRGNEVIEAFGLSDIYYVLGLSRPNEVMVDDQNHHPQLQPSEGNFLGDQTGMVVGPADSHRDVLPPLP